MSSSLLSRITSPTVLLYTFLVIAQFGRGAYFASGNEPSPAFTLINTLAFFWIMCWWLLRDSSNRGIASVYDIGMFLYIAWPFIMPYYLLKSRGAKGLLVILGFVGAYVGAVLMGIAFYLLLDPSAR
jgi:hypothetical protein